MKVPLLDLKAQYAAIREPVRRVLDEICEAQAFVLGPYVERFEREVAAYTGAAHAIGVSSGTDALLVALMALDVGPGDAVITTPYSFFATAGSVARLGATPVFADIDPRTCNLDPACVRRLLEAWPERLREVKPRVLMPVHLFGQMADMDPLRALAREFGLRIVEDAAQAIGCDYPSADGPVRAGTAGDLGCFSFYPSKNLGGFGDGGLVTARDEALAEKVRCLRNHGAEPKYYHRFIGGNFRLDALQAGVLSVKLKHLPDWHRRRRDNAARYDELLRDLAVQRPEALYRGSGVDNPHIYNQYVIRVADRDRVRQALTEAGIGTEIYYPVPLHLQECFRNLGYREGDAPESERAAAETLALPIYPELTEEQQAAVATALAAAAAGGADRRA